MISKGRIACCIAGMSILFASSAVLLWDGTLRFNRVEWHCHHHSAHKNTTLGAIEAFLRGDAAAAALPNNIIVPGMYYDDDNSNSNGCAPWYDQAAAEYTFGILFGIIAIIATLSFIGELLEK